MDSQQQVLPEDRKISEAVAAEGNEIEQSQQDRAPTGVMTAAAAAANSPPVLSAASSPSHEFSFTVSLHSSATMISKESSSPSVAAKTKQHQQLSPLAIDLSPADEIFFHGHLLPLHFLSHLHASSARPSTHSLDSFAPPILDVLQEENILTSSTTENSSTACSCTEDDHFISFNQDYDVTKRTDCDDIHSCRNKDRNSNSKSKSFSLFSKWKKLSEGKEKSDCYTTENSKRNKLKFDVSQFLKRYINMVKPLLSPRAGRRESVRVRRQSYSFSGTVSPRDNRELMRGRRGEFSAPASMRTSPTNSGLLLATAGVPSPVSDSTMEELQAAIQSAIAHCKNSISTEEKKSQEISSSIPVN